MQSEKKEFKTVRERTIDVRKWNTQLQLITDETGICRDKNLRSIIISSSLMENFKVQNVVNKLFEHSSLHCVSIRIQYNVRVLTDLVEID